MVALVRQENEICLRALPSPTEVGEGGVGVGEGQRPLSHRF